MEELEGLVRVSRMMRAGTAIQRILAAREVANDSALLGGGDLSTLIDLIVPSALAIITQDPDFSVRAAWLSALGPIVGTLLATDQKIIVDDILNSIKLILSERDCVPEVRRAAMQALLDLAVYIPEGERRDTILPIPVSLAHDPDSAQSRCLALHLLAKLSSSLGPLLCTQFVVPQVCCLAEDACVDVRVAATYAVGVLCNIVDSGTTRHRLLPPFLRCCEDSESQVRLSATQNLLCIADATSPSVVREFLIPKLRSMLQDQDRSVQSTAQAVLGPLLVYLMDNVPDDLLNAFLDLSEIDTIDYGPIEDESPARRCGRPLGGPYGTFAAERSWWPDFFPSRKSPVETNNVRCIDNETNQKLGLSYYMPDLCPAPAAGVVDSPIMPLPIDALYGTLPRTPQVYCAYSFAAVFAVLCGSGQRLFVRHHPQLGGNGQHYPRWDETTIDKADDGIIMTSPGFIPQLSLDSITAAAAAYSEDTNNSPSNKRSAVAIRGSSSSHSTSSVESVNFKSNRPARTSLEWWKSRFRNPFFALLRGIPSARRILACSLNLIVETLLLPPGSKLSPDTQHYYMEATSTVDTTCQVVGAGWDAFGTNNVSDPGLVSNAPSSPSPEASRDIMGILLSLLRDSNADVQMSAIGVLPSVLSQLPPRFSTKPLIAVQKVVWMNRLQTISSHQLRPEEEPLSDFSENSGYHQEESNDAIVDRSRGSRSGPINLINRLKNTIFNTPRGTRTAVPLTTTEYKGPRDLPSWRVRLEAAVRFDQLIAVAADNSQPAIYQLWTILLDDPVAQVRQTTAAHTGHVLQKYCRGLCFLGRCATWKLPEARYGALHSAEKILYDDMTTELEYDILARVKGLINTDEDKKLDMSRLSLFADELKFVIVLHNLSIDTRHHQRILFMRCCSALLLNGFNYELITLFLSFLYADFIKLANDPVVSVRRCWAACVAPLLRSNNGGLLSNSKLLRSAVVSLTETTLCETKSSGFTASQELLESLNEFNVKAEEDKNFDTWAEILDLGSSFSQDKDLLTAVNELASFLPSPADLLFYDEEEEEQNSAPIVVEQLADTPRIRCFEVVDSTTS